MIEDQDTRCAAPSWAHSGYQCGLAAVAHARHGSVSGLKGVVHECAYVLHHNLNPLAFLEKGWAQLSPNLRDPVNDVVFTNGLGVQLKDTISANGARATARRAASYGTQVLGTPETVAAVGKQGVRIGSSDISSAHNEGIAARAGCLSRAALLHNVKSGAMHSAFIGAVFALLRGYDRVCKGEATWEDVLGDVVREAAISGVSGAAAALAGTVAAALAMPGPVAVLISAVVGLLVAYFASKFANAKWDEYFPGAVNAAAPA
jgi:hypothetical protein